MDLSTFVGDNSRPSTYEVRHYLIRSMSQIRRCRLALSVRVMEIGIKSEGVPRRCAVTGCKKKRPGLCVWKDNMVSRVDGVSPLSASKAYGVKGACGTHDPDAFSPPAWGRIHITTPFT